MAPNGPSVVADKFAGEVGGVVSPEGGGVVPPEPPPPPPAAEVEAETGAASPPPQPASAKASTSIKSNLVIYGSSWRSRVKDVRNIQQYVVKSTESDDISTSLPAGMPEFLNASSYFPLYGAAGQRPQNGNNICRLLATIPFHELV